MAINLQFYSALAEHTAKDITAKHENWTSFLDTAARLYKYSFPDKLMIYAQSPEAVACAPMEVWNDSFNRWVRRGTNGIALIDDSGSYPKIKYVFDVTDTEADLENSRSVRLWEMRQEHNNVVLEALAKTYDVGDSLADSFRSIAEQLTKEYYDDNAREIRYRAEGSLLEELDDDNLRVVFENALSTSVAYMLISRCGLSPEAYLDDEDFRFMHDFNTPDMVYALGTATSDLAEQVLRDVEITIKNYERQMSAERSENNHEQTDVHAIGGLHDTRHQTERAAAGADRTGGQVRENEESISERASNDNVQLHAPIGEVVSASAGDGAVGERKNDSGDGHSDIEEPAAQQSDRPDGLDSSDEHFESTSRGTSLERTDLHINEQQGASPVQEIPDADGASLSATSYSQLENSSIEELLSGSMIKPDEFDALLRTGGNRDNHFVHDEPFSGRSTLRIAAHFAKGLDDNEDYLKLEYLHGRYRHSPSESGKGLNFGSHNVCAWFSEAGIDLAVGVTAKNNIHKTTIPWAIAAMRVDELMREGQYVSGTTFENALENERCELASKLWHFYRDDFGGIPEAWKSHEGYTGDLEIIKSFLIDPNKCKEILAQLEKDIDAWSSEPQERAWHDPVDLLDSVRRLMVPAVIKPQQESVASKEYSYFITQDEIDGYLLNSNKYHDGKYSILSFFLNDHDEKEKIEFIKHLYGTGGGTFVEVDGRCNTSPGKGITIQRGDVFNPCAEISLKWNAVSKRIQALIASGQYLTRNELDYIPDYERLELIHSINHFYYGLSEEYERPFPGKTGLYPNEYRDEDGDKILDFHYPRKAEWQALNDLLDNPERVDSLLAQMQYIFENTSAEDRYYSYRKVAFEALSAFRDGRYTLFPGIENLPEPGTPMYSKVDVSTERVRGPRVSDNASTAQSVQQISIFDIGTPVLPTVEEQKRVINQKQQQEAEQKATVAEAQAPAISMPDDGSDLFLDISDSDKQRLIVQFENNPRSREAANLVREIYGDTLDIPLPQAIKRISELAKDGRFRTANEVITESIGAIANSEEEKRSHLYEQYQQAKTIAPPDSVIMLPVGAFFELYGKDAEIAEEQLGLSVTYRSAPFPERTKMCGFPDWVLATNIEKLTEANYTVAVVNISDKGEVSVSVHSPVLPLAEEIEEPAPELDFDTVALTYLDRVMADADYKEALTTTKTRALLRNPCTWVLEQTVRDHEHDEPEVFHRYFSDSDFNDDLFAFILKQSWEQRPQPIAAVEQEKPLPAFYEIDEPIDPAEIEAIFGGSKAQSDNAQEPPEVVLLLSTLSFSSTPTTAYYLFHYPSETDSIAALSHDTLSLIQEKSDSYVICADVCNLSESDLADWGIVFRKMPRDWNRLPVSVQDQLRTIRPDYEQKWHSMTQHERDFEEWKEAKESEQTVTPIVAPAANFRITDDNLGEGGAKTKFRNNIVAIRTMLSVERENRNATPEEQETLSRYVGWGGLPQAFDEENKQWAGEYAKLRELLPDKEYESARASTLNAYYTSPNIIKAMYEAVKRMGFSTGNILEPACGIGNFFGLLPDSMKDSKLYGVELDSITARIAKQLYPQADIRNMGFEKTDFPDSFFDISIGNVPFGDYGVSDKHYEKHKFAIHNYFIAKALDQVRPGGVVALITSKYTLDEKSPTVRKYIAERAELLGAVRLPNDAFLLNAGTETTMDILFLQKRDRPLDVEPEWVHLGLTDDEIPVNRYYLDNPEMLIGTMALDKRMNDKYGRHDITCCLPIEGADLASQLKSALSNIQGEIAAPELDDIEGIDNHAIPADPSVKNFSYTVVDDTVYFRENSQMFPVELPATTLERIKGMVELRDCVHQLISLQLEDYSDAEITSQQTKLDILYEKFTKKFGLINSQGNSRAFNADSAYYLLCSLEILDEDGNLERKADMFTKRTIKQRTVVTHVDTASEALAVSIGERACVDMDYMSQLTGKDEETLFSELRSVIYADYDMDVYSNNIKHCEIRGFTYQTADEFLSGNIREKLRKYSEARDVLSTDSPFYQSIDDNVIALKAVQPTELTAPEIAVRLGSTWVDPEYIQEFVFELLKTPEHLQEACRVYYHSVTGEWQIAGKGRATFGDINSTVTYGTERMNGYEIICDTLNLRDVRVYDLIREPDGSEKRVLNKKETTLAQQKQEQIKQEFQDWIWKDPERRQTLVKLYNERFNSTRVREYDGSHITFSGISPEITLRQHQLAAIAHILYGGNTLLAHEVGAGKSATRS